MKNKIIVDVKPRVIESTYIRAPFDQAKEALEQVGYHITSLQENARLRIQEGKDSDVSRYGNWTKEGVLYVPRKGVFLTRNSPIMANAKQATQCHRNCQDFYLTDEQVEESLQDSVELTRRDIPVTRFGEDEITRYAFGEDAERYGEFLKEAGIGAMPVFSGRVSNKPFARQMWFSGVDTGDGSYLGGDGGNLGNDSGVRGVRNSAEGTAQTLEVYTPAQLEDALNTLGFPGLSKSLVDKLREE